MRSEKSETLIIYFSSLGPQRVGVNKAMLWAVDDLRALGLTPILRSADLITSIVDVGRNLFRRASAIVFVGMGLGFGYGSLVNLAWSAAVYRRVFLSWQEDRWVYDRIMRACPGRGRIFNEVIKWSGMYHFVISERGKRFCMALGVKEHQIHVVGSCAPAPEEAVLNFRVFPDDNRLRVMAAATIQARKGTDIFCEAAIKVCRRLSNVDFFWFGEPLGFEPGFYERCRELVRLSGLEDRIRFCGFVDKPSVFIAHCDMFVQTSRDEPLGLSALEAMAFGKTVIGFDVGGLPELMGGCYHVLGQPNADRLAEKIIELASGNRSDLIREDARRRVLDVYNPREYALRLAQAIRSVTAK
jgi:glycosyltransferase involved in cell wall biosynthesis